MSAATSLPARIRHLSFLVGRWRGVGQGSFPTISDFRYVEEAVFAPVPGDKPVLSYEQQTWRAGEGDAQGVAMHSESGYVRVDAEGNPQFCVAHIVGLAEVCAGTADGKRMRVASTSLGRCAGSKEPSVTQIAREFWIDDEDADCLRYKVYMATTRTPELTLHLEAALRRVE